MKPYDIAAYIWPSYHYEPRLEHFWPEKDGEWYTVRRATSRFPGHEMPRVPLFGCQDEADPNVMRQHVSLASEHGVNVFIMDWYWYENAPCLERQLNDGLIPALEGTDSRFYLMWANHDASTLWDMHTDERNLLWSGQVDRAELEVMFDRVIDRYLKLDSYYCIDGKPVFSIFHPANLIAGLGGLEATRNAFDWMRKRCVEKGLPGLHLQVIPLRCNGVEGGAKLGNITGSSMNEALQFDSATSYQHAHDSGSTGDYAEWVAKAITQWPVFEEQYGTYFPHVSIGWDNTQRMPSAAQESVVTNATPEAFKAGLLQARAWLEAHPDRPPLVTINSWNEWTEGSYLLPDTLWQYDYLRAVRDVFGKRTSPS